MGQITRKYDFVAGTKIRSQYVDEELDQLVNSNNELDTRMTAAEILTAQVPNKTDKTGNHLGSWQGLQPTDFETGTQAINLANLNSITQEQGERLKKQDRLLAHHEAMFSIDNRAMPSSGKFYDIYDGTTQDLSVATMKTAKTSTTSALSIGATVIPVLSVTGFSILEEVTIYDDTNIQRVVIQSINGNNLTVTALDRAFKNQAQVAHSMSVIDSIEKALEFGGWDTSTTITRSDVSVVASAYDTSGNGGRKLVRLDNGWLVAIVTTTAAKTFYLMVSKDNGLTWSQLCFRNTATNYSVYQVALINKGNNIYVIEYADNLNFFKIDALTQTNIDISSTKVIVDSGQSAFNGCSLTINDTGTELHAAWASKNATYPNSFNIRYAKGTINADGSVTWGAVEQVSTANTTGYDKKNPTIAMRASVPHLFYDWARTNEYAIVHRKKETTSWSGNQYVYSDATYAQSNPSAIFVPQSINGLTNGRIWVAWHGFDSTHTSTHNIRIAYSDDGGVTWSSMQKLTTESTITQAYASITFNKNNEVFILWGGSTSANYLRTIKYSNGSWGSVTTLLATGTAYSHPSTLVDADLDFTEPLFIYKGTDNASVRFRGTWTASSTTPILENDIRYTINTSTDEVAMWIERLKLVGFTVTSSVSIVDSTASENYQAMTKQTYTISDTKEEDEFIGSVTTIGNKVTLKITMTRTNTSIDGKITKLLGAVA